MSENIVYDKESNTIRLLSATIKENKRRIKAIRRESKRASEFIKSLEELDDSYTNLFNITSNTFERIENDNTGIWKIWFYINTKIYINPILILNKIKCYLMKKRLQSIMKVVVGIR